MTALMRGYGPIFHKKERRGLRMCGAGLLPAAFDLEFDSEFDIEFD